MRLRTRIALVAMLATVLVAAALLATAHMSQKQIEERFAEAATSGKSVLWRKIIASQFDSMEANTSGLARDRATREALKNRDQAALQESANTTFNLLTASKVLTRLQLTDLGGRVLYSAPGPFEGETRKSLVIEAIEEGKIKRGIERDDDGRLVAVVTFPLYTRGQAIGAAVYARELDDAIADFSRNDESEVFIADERARLEYGTRSELFSKLQLSLPPMGASSAGVAELSGNVYSVISTPLADSKGVPVARLLTVKDYTESYRKQKRIETTSYLGIGGILAIVLAGLYWFMNRALRPLSTVVERLNDIATGDLTAEIEVQSRCEIGQLQAAMKATVENLRDMIGDVNAMTVQLGASAGRMNRVTEQTQQDVGQQRSELAQVATAMNEMTATVDDVARNAGEAASAAANADEEAGRGNEVVLGTVRSIHELAEEVERAGSVIQQVRMDSENIGSILNVIRGIAEQTNLLALNAAIEAARAGEQGRGFAVVADEVRTLASRTGESTRQIQEMIERLQSGTESAVHAMETSHVRAKVSVEQAGKAGDSLKAITKAVTSISEMNYQIASAAEEQTAVAEEISRNVVTINELAESSTNSAQQTALAGEELNALSAQLSRLVERFKV